MPRACSPPLADDPIWALIKAYEDTCHELRELRTEIASLQAKETILEAKRISMHAFLARPAKDQLFATFDIMGRIFEYAVHSAARSDRGALYCEMVREAAEYPVVDAIARVCTVWRNTAIRVPSLWQKISFIGEDDTPEGDFPCVSFRLRSWLRRSYPLPLTIHWTDRQSVLSDEPVKWIKSLFDALAAQSSRWQTVELRIPFPQYSPSFPLDLQNLKHLYINNIGEDTIPALGNMPSLRNLALAAYETAIETTFPWQQLTTLRIFHGIHIPRPVLQACSTLERLYVELDEDPPFLIDQDTELPSLRHLTLHYPIMHAQLGCLNLGFLDSMTVDYISSDLPSIQESGEFFERSSRLRILQVNFRELEPQDHISFFSVFRSRAVRILRLKLDHVLGLDDSSVLLSLLTCFTISRLTQNFSALKEIHLDATSTDEEPCALSIESITFTAVRLASTANQTPSPLSVGLHIPASFIEPLSHTFESSEKLRVSSTPLDFDDIGVDSFMDGDLLLSHDRNVYPP